MSQALAKLKESIARMKAVTKAIEVKPIPGKKTTAEEIRELVEKRNHPVE